MHFTSTEKHIKIVEAKASRGADYILVQVIVFIFTIFIGWFMFDLVKHKKIIKENVLTALIAAIVAGAAYYVLFVLF
ncbi:hypothetical protein [Anaerobacillus arseniciselenatis]|uniref:hypothetical protein n=1 Tax=Anaerobacillus arseniciselenatis TaxID=85682 RepID=UPI00147096B9|nr:hypothetical protein [Anaerobacillus arseniciselenatis]